MGLPPRVFAPAYLVLVLGAGTAMAGGVAGKVEVPAAPARAGVTSKGFLDRVENPLAPVKAVATTPHMLVVLDGEAPAGGTPMQIVWDLVGESFAKPVIGAQVGAKVEIKNTSRTPRSLAAKGQPKLLEGGPLNPSGVRSFRVETAGVIEVGDSDAPHLKGMVVVVASPYFATVDAGGKFDLGEVPEGTYKLRVFYGTGWIDQPEQQVVVPAKGKADVTVKIPAGYPLKK